MTRKENAAAAYADDLAYVHATGFADLARGAAPFLSAWAHNNADDDSGDGAIVDLGCGSGVILAALLRAGHHNVVGVDLSPAMLALAKKAAPRARLIEASLYDAPLPKACAAVFAVGEPLSYGKEPLAPFFKKVHRALAPKGHFAFDVIVEGEPSLTRRSWTAGDGWACLVDTVEDVKRLRLTRDITTFRAASSTKSATSSGKSAASFGKSASYRRAQEVHHVRVLRERAVVRMLAHAGFDVTVASSYGKHPLAVRRRAFLCTKRSS